MTKSRRLRFILWRSWLHFRNLFPRAAYVVIYDWEKPSGEVIEEYYGYFDTPDIALEAFYALRAAGPEQYTNAKVCRIIRDIADVRSEML